MSANSIEQKYVRTGIILSMVGGFIFACSAWGYDFVILTISHSVLPWVKFAAGTIEAILTAGICGWLCMRSGRLPVIMALWFVWGLLAAWTASLLPFTLQPAAMQTFSPLLGGKISYFIPENNGTRLFLAWLIVLGISLIISFLYANLVDSVHANINPGSTIMSVAIWGILFIIMGKSIDSVYNQSLRSPIQLTHTAIQEARTHISLLDNSSEASKHQILAMRPLKGVLDKPYTLAVKSYDRTFEDVVVLADMGGFWYECDVSYDHVNICR